MTLVDTNVLIDLASNDPTWGAWSEEQMYSASLAGPLYFNDAVYAELAVRFDTVEALDAFLNGLRVEASPIPKPALFLAGKVFSKYRRAGGVRTGVMPDFLIGAHAMVAGLPLLTRDIGRYRTYFPDLRLIAPILD